MMTPGKALRLLASSIMLRAGLMNVSALVTAALALYAIYGVWTDLAVLLYVAPIFALASLIELWLWRR